jgi:hypothetical protein
MSVEILGDGAIGLSRQSIIVSAGLEDYNYGVEVKKSTEPPYINVDFTQTPWSPWGGNNLMPKEIADDIENCGVLAAALDAKARIGTGKGIEPFLLMDIKDGKEQLEWVNDPEILDWLELNDSFSYGLDSSYDTHTYGWSCGSYILNRGRNKIYRVKRHDVYEARLEKMDQRTGIINNMYLCADWGFAPGTAYDPTKQARIALLEEGNELGDLEMRVANNKLGLEYGFMNRTLRNGRKYYPIPLYRSSKIWIKIARSVPLDKIAMFKNQITIKYVVVIHPKFWEDKFGQLDWNKYTPEEKTRKREEYYDKIDGWLTGTDNAYKSLFTGGFLNEETGKFTPYVEVQEITDKLKDGKFLPDSGAAVSEILFALMINPALMGAGSPNGGQAYGSQSHGSNVRETYLSTIMLMESERRQNASVFNVVKKFNGWSKRLEVKRTFVPTVPLGAPTPESKIITPRLVFRNPAGILTTLDTGKSTKSETT